MEGNTSPNRRMLVNYTLIFVALVLFAGLAVDAGLLERNYLQLQTGAKAAAVGTSIVLQRTSNSTSAIYAGQAAAIANGFTNGVGGVTVTITVTPISSSYSSTILATITESTPPTFMRLLGMGNVNMKAQSSLNEGVPVNLSSYYNVIAIYTDGHAIPNGGGFDSGFAFSANLLGLVRESSGLGAILSWRGNIFTLAPANASNGVTQTTVQLPHARPYSQLLIAASTAWAYASIFSATFVVTYSDGSTATSNFNMSDWCVPGYYPGETMVSGQAYRDQSPSGTEDPRQNYVYGYTINVDNTKTLSTLKLPTQRNVVILAIDVVP